MRDELKNLVRFRRASPTKRTSGGALKGVGGGGGGGGGGAALHLSWAFFDFLMRFLDPRIFDIHRPRPGPQENMQIGGVRCAISQIWSKFREMLGENPADIHL